MSMTMTNRRLLVLGAHPDDAEFHAGGISRIALRQGWQVRWVSATDGGAGHHELDEASLVARRKQELKASALEAGAEAVIWPFPDGWLFPDRALREAVLREIRDFRPDLVLTHRPFDYHPDHRALGQAVQDACYLVTVPGVLRGIPPVEREPIVAYLQDPFERPVPFSPHLVLDVSQELDGIVSLLAHHESQFFEFLPISFGAPSPVPEDLAARRVWLREWFLERTRWRAQKWWPGSGGTRPELIEALEVAEYARKPLPGELEVWFPGGRRVRGT